MEQPFFAGFTPEQKHEVALAVDQVDAIRNAYVAVQAIAAEAASADLAASSNPTVARERGEAIAASQASSSALLHELSDYSNKFAMSPTGRAGAARFVQQLVLAREGDTAALATVAQARQELGEAERDRATLSNKPSTVAAGDVPLPAAGTIEVISAIRANQAALQAALPEHFKNRYIRVGETIVDAKSPAKLVLVDKGRRLDAPDKYTGKTVAAMVDIAEARTWRSINVKGKKEFKAAIYLEAASRGLAVRGYSPSKRERELAEAAYAARQQRQAEANEHAARNANHITDTAEGFATAITAEAEPGGRILKHGKDFYNHDRAEKMSYFVTLETARGERTIWGLGLEEALRTAGARTGDRVRLEHLGNQAVEVDANIRDKDGRVIGQERIQSHRNAWAVHRLDQEATRTGDAKEHQVHQAANRNPANATKAFLGARSDRERQEAMKAHPELRAAFAAEAIATSAAGSIKPYAARQAFMERFRDSIAQDLAAGRKLPDAALQAPINRDQRDRDASQGPSR